MNPGKEPRAAQHRHRAARGHRPARIDVHLAGADPVAVRGQHATPDGRDRGLVPGGPEHAERDACGSGGRHRGERAGRQRGHRVRGLGLERRLVEQGKPLEAGFGEIARR